MRPQAPSPAPVEERRKALNALFNEYWEANLQNSPEFASTIGDKRFNDKLSDYSVSAINNWLATEQNFLMRLAAIDATAFNDQEKTSRDLLLRDLAEDLEGSEFKEWEMPVTQMSGVHTEYPRLVAELDFYHGEGLRRLDRAAACASQGVRADHNQHVHRHRRPSRAAKDCA